ncbi:hypothetical protein ABFT23_11820 [Nocardioides sp. C4-1]
MAKPKRNAFALLGWVVWKLLALFGLQYAKDKLKHDRHRRA